MGSTELRNRCFMKLSKSDKQATLACDKTAQGADSWGTTTLKPNKPRKRLEVTALLHFSRGRSRVGHYWNEDSFRWGEWYYFH